MKKMIGLFAIFLLASCSQQNVAFNNVSKPDENITTENEVLVAYFSRTGENYSVGNIDVGNTAIMGGYIQEKLNCDIYEIIPTVKYPDSYEECKLISQQETSEDVRPKIENLLESIDKYDTIYLGYPIWYGSFPQIILSYLDSYDFSGKTIYPFVTDEGSGLSGTVARLTSYLPDSTIGDGLAIRGSSIRNESSRDAVNKWVKSH